MNIIHYDIYDAFYLPLRAVFGLRLLFQAGLVAFSG